MAVSAIGNMNFINQNMAAPAQQISNEIAKDGFAAMMNLSEFNEKEKNVNRLEKVAQSNEAQNDIKEKEDNEGGKKHKNQEQNQNEEELFIENEEESFDDEEESPHKLDLSV